LLEELLPLEPESFEDKSSNELELPSAELLPKFSELEDESTPTTELELVDSSSSGNFKVQEINV